MYDSVIRFPLRAKIPVYEIIAASTGTLTYTSATWTLTANDGTSVSSGSVDGSTGTGTASVTVYKTVDGPSLSLSAGLYIFHFEPLVTGSDSIARVEPMDIILVIAGTYTHTIYPTAADVQVELVARGLRALTPIGADLMLDLDTAAQVGRREFERATGRQFLAVTRTLVRDYPQGTKRLPLNADIASSVGLTVSVSGTAKVLNTDYYLKPDNADAYGEPWTAIEFAAFSYYLPVLPARAISITGSIGYGTTIPVEAWRAMRDVACMECLPGIQALLTGGLVSWTEAGISENYGKQPFDGAITLWTNRIEKAETRLRRVTAGVTA